ncbi:MAG: rbsB [Microbacteriaceae bacterium]|nr:rbsB [Microbacteriaceae bacterium]
MSPQHSFRTRNHNTSRSKKMLSLATIALAGLALSACSASTPSSNASAKASDGPIGISWASLANPAAIGDLKQVEKALEAEGMKALPAVNANGDANKQNSDIRNLIASGAKGLIIFTVDPFTIAPALTYAKSQNVPVVAVDVLPQGGKLYMNVSSNNKLMGQMQCKSLGEQTGGTGKVLLILGSLKDTAGQDRASGVSDCLKDKFPNLQVIQTPSTDWLPEKAAQYAQTLIPANPDIKAIGLASDGVQLPAVSQVLKQLNRWVPAGQSGHIFLDAIDGTPLALEQIRAGYLDSTVVQPYDLYAQAAVASLKDAFAGKVPVEGDSSGFGGAPVTKLAGNFLTQPAPIIVTKDNAADTALWGNQG